MTTAQTYNQALAAVVRAAIESSRRTQREVSEESGVPLVTLNRKLGGHTPFNFLELAEIAAVLDTSVTDLTLRAERAATLAAA